MSNHFKKYIAPLLISLGVSWIGFLIVIIRLEPCRTYSSTNFCGTISSLGMIMFFLSLFFALTTFFSLAGYLSRLIMYKSEIISTHFTVSIRQGILLSICSIAILTLFAFDVLRWWTTLLIFLSIILIEFYFLSRDSY